MKKWRCMFVCCAYKKNRKKHEKQNKNQNKKAGFDGNIQRGEEIAKRRFINIASLKKLYVPRLKL